MTTHTPPALPSDLEAGLRRLKLAAIRRNAPEVLLTAKSQRWAPEETLRVLVDLEVTARDESNMRARMAAARFPVEKDLDGFNLTESSIPPATHDYLVTLDWIRRADNLCLIGPAGTGKTHYLIGLGRAAVATGNRVRYYTAIDLVETLWRALADNTVGKTIEQICRNQLIIIDEVGFAPLDHTGCQLLFRLISAAYEKRSLAVASHSPFEDWGRFLPDQPTAVSLLDRLCHHAHIITTSGQSYRLTHRSTGGGDT
ncbi:MAG: IS21-like element helper ATPase IstB [Acidimicrobiia bacterium]